MSDIKDWSTTAASNNSNSPNGFPEGMAPSEVNDAAREVMASVREYYDSPEWRDWGHTIAYAAATQFTTDAGDGDTTAIYHANRRVKANGSTTGTIYGTISSSSHGAQTTVTVTWDSGSLNSEALTIWVGASADTEHIDYSAIASTPSAEFAGGNTVFLVFRQASAPTGWTQSTTHNDRALRVVSGSGGGTGGTQGLSSPPGTGHTHFGPSHVHSGPSHNHIYFNWVDTNSPTQVYNSSGNAVNFAAGIFGQFNIDEYMYSIIESSGPLAPVVNIDLYTGNAGTGNTGSGGTGSTSSDGPTAFVPQFLDVIVCSKD